MDVALVVPGSAARERPPYLLVAYATIAVSCFALSYTMPDVRFSLRTYAMNNFSTLMTQSRATTDQTHHLVEMRLISYLVLSFTLAAHSARFRGAASWALPFFGGWLIMALAYLPDVPLTSQDYLYYRSITWLFYTFLMCSAVTSYVDLKFSS